MTSAREEAPALRTRRAQPADLDAIRRIYNEGIEDRIATLDESPKSEADLADWWSQHSERFAVLVALDATGEIVGWASLNRYSRRAAYDRVGELSIYITRRSRGTGVGSILLAALETHAKEQHFHKIVLFTLPINAGGQALYRKFGYREVGVFIEQGKLDGVYVDVMAMEKILGP